LGLREIIVLTPFLGFVFWIGLGPQPFIDLIHGSVAHLLDQFHTWQQHPQVASLLLR
jgi:NADH-quinone oxidoreductase subunit M